MTARARPGPVLRQLVLALTTAAAMAIDDPALLAVQASRRAPRGLTATATRVLRGATPRTSPSRRALAAWLAGHRDEARAAVAEALADGAPRPTRRILAEIAVELDEPGLAVHGGPRTRARAAWRAGALDDAVRLAGTSSLGRRLASERRAMSPGTALAVTPAARGPHGAPPAGAPRTAPVALHLLTNSLPHTSSGYTLRSHAVLTAQRAAGVDVAALTRLGYPVSVGRVAAQDVEHVDGVPYHRLLPWRTAGDPGSRLRQTVDAALPVLDATRPTVLHTTTNWTNGVVTRALARQTGLPWVYEVRGLLEETWVASFPTPEARAAARASQRHSLLRAREAELAAAADHVVTLGSTVRDDLVARGVDPSRITLVPNAVADELLTLDQRPADARLALGLPGDGFWVGTVSSLVDYEGLDTLLSAVALLRRRGLDVRAAIVGDGVARPALERQVAEAGLTPHVVLPGRVPPARAVDWYLALDAFAVPRRDTAVTRAVVPLKPMSAMALGRPVVGSDLPALAEIVSGPGAGLLTAPDDAHALAEAIAQVAQDADLASRFGSAGRRFAATRTWGTAGATYRALYERLAT